VLQLVYHLLRICLKKKNPLLEFDSKQMLDKNVDFEWNRFEPQHIIITLIKNNFNSKQGIICTFDHVPLDRMKLPNPMVCHLSLQSNMSQTIHTLHH